MADDCCKELLEAWNLENLVSHFKDNGIDKRTMQHLTTDLIKELIPHIGDRIKFTSKWQQYITDTSPNDQDKSRQKEDLDTTVSVSNTSSESLENNNSDEINSVGEAVFQKIKRPHVRHILKKSMEGSAILKSYQKTKLLSRSCRRVIVNLVISEIFKDMALFQSFKADDLKYVADEIVEVFPSETSESYYVPPVRKQQSRNKKSITCRGKFVDKFRNKKQEYQRLTGCKFDNYTSSASSATDELRSDLETEDDVETRNSILWLKQNQAPWKMVVSHWVATSKFRRDEIMSSTAPDVCGIFDKWPILRHPMGHVLIDEDFKYMQLSKVDDVIDNWQVFFDKIEKLSQENHDKRPTDLNDLLETEDLNTDSKVAVQLSLLPYLVPPKGRVRTKNDHWKPSINECKESIIVHAKILGDVSHLQEKRVEAMQRMKLTVQPYIIVVGPTIQALSTFYVCIDKTLYDVPSILKAIDICFEAFHVLNACYPPESEHLWYLMQFGLYRFSTKYDKLISYIMEIVNILKK